MQIAAHEEVIPLEELYDICEKVRELTKDPKYLIGRIIARPYVGEPGAFKRLNAPGSPTYGRAIILPIKYLGSLVNSRTFSHMS